jgi:hypothetical protein
MSEFWSKMKASKAMRFFKIISESASFALFLSIIFFAYEMIENMQESKEMTDNLVQIQNSLTTKYLGIFPNYLPAINQLYENANQGDSIVIFEDVLYYGIKSKPEEFKSFNLHLLNLRNSGSNVIVAYYNPKSTVFHKMIQEGRFPSYVKEMQNERRHILDSLNAYYKTNYTDFMRIDSILSEKYFTLEKKNNPQKIKDEISAYLKPIHIDNNEKLVTRAEQDINEMCIRIDSIKGFYLNGDGETITFADYKAMYKAMSEEVTQLYKKYGFELIPLNDYLMMSCWLAGDKIIFAFPSKYNTDEIGFASQDPAFSKYVRTMLEGVKH